VPLTDATFTSVRGAPPVLGPVLFSRFAVGRNSVVVVVVGATVVVGPTVVVVDSTVVVVGSTVVVVDSTVVVGATVVVVAGTVVVGAVGTAFARFGTPAAYRIVTDAEGARSPSVQRRWV
jgi:hypothetical protein